MKVRVGVKAHAARGLAEDREEDAPPKAPEGGVSVPKFRLNGGLRDSASGVSKFATSGSAGRRDRFPAMLFKKSTSNDAGIARARQLAAPRQVDPF
ncbi:unnamed protein product [Effrenium voratum]|nr:unnamed protein product [Effrenium voratum]